MSEMVAKENELLLSDNLYNVLKQSRSVFGEGHPMFNKKHKPESRLKIKQARSKQIIMHSDETKKKIGDAHRGRKFSPERCKKMSEIRMGHTPWNKGKKTGISPANKIIVEPSPIIERYNSGDSVESIRLSMKISWDTVHRILVENNIKIRSIKEQKSINDERKRINKTNL